MRKVIVIAAALVLAACGTNQTDRALSGAGIGAGAGLLLDRPIEGAIIGGAAGALTRPQDINLGQPIWQR